MIDVKQITRLNDYNEPILDNVSFHISEGDFAVIFGGDSECRMRLLHCIMGYEMYYSGAVRFGEKVKVVRYVPADVFYDGKMTVGQYMILNRKRFDSFDEEKCNKLCQQYEIDVNEVLGDMTYEDNKIIQVIAAVCCSPDILIIDEAEQFVCLDKMIMLLDYLRKLNEKGLTIIYSCDNYETVKGYCNRYIMLHEGKVIAETEVPEEDIRQRVITIEGDATEIQDKFRDENIVTEHIVTKNGRSSYVYSGSFEKLPDILRELSCKDFIIEEMTLAEELTHDYSRWKTL